MSGNDLAAARGGVAFVGRQPELRVIAHVIGDARAGNGALLALVGPAGMGKTRLALEAARRAADAGLRVSWGHARQESPRPAGLWREALQPLLPEMTWLDEAAALGRDQLLGAIASEVDSLASSGPLALVLEDLHWSDELSLAELDWLRPRLAHLPVLVVATAREPLRCAGRPDHELRLQALTETEIAALFHANAGDEEIDTHELAKRTGGNPLFVLEVARYGFTAVPDSVADIVRSRLAPLDASTRHVVEVAAVLGEEVPVEVLGAVATASAEDRRHEVEHALDAARAAALLLGEHGGRTLAFEHALVRDAVYAQTEPGARRRLHEHAARQLQESATPDAADVARHLCAARAIVAGDAEIATWAARAGEAAAAMCAHSEAAEWFDRARVAVADGSREWLDLLLRAADARYRAGARDEAWRAYEEAASVAMRRDDHDALARAALGFGGGRTGFEVPPTHETQRRLLHHALDLLPPGEHAMRSLVLSRLSITLAFEGQPDRQRELGGVAVVEARASGDAAAIVTALSSWCDAHGSPDHVRERLREAGEMASIAAKAGDAELELLGLRFQIVALMELGRRTEVERAIARFTDLAARLRQPSISFYGPLFAATLAHVDGRLDEAERCNAEVAAIGEIARSENARILAASQRFAIWIDRRRGADFEEEVRSFVATVPEVSGPLAGLALLDAAAGRIESAHAKLERFRAEGFRTFPIDAEWLSSVSTVGEAAALSGHAEAAADLLPLVLPHRGLFVVDGIGASVPTTASLAAGRLATVVGDIDLADELLAEAADDARRFGAPLLLAKALWSWSEALHERDPGRSSALRAAAEATIDDLGLDPSPLVPLPRGGGAATAPPLRPADATVGAFLRDGEVWTLAWRGGETGLRDSKGLRYLHELITRPHREVHALDLLAAPGGAAIQQGDLGPVLDEAARRAYRRQIQDLRDEIDEAHAAHDTARAAKRELELDAIMQHLVTATGLGGRARTTGSAAERARVNVTKSIRQAIERIDPLIPALAHHLRTTIRTGTYCAYEPDPTDTPMWRLEAGSSTPDAAQR